MTHTYDRETGYVQDADGRTVAIVALWDEDLDACHARGETIASALAAVEALGEPEDERKRRLVR